MAGGHLTAVNENGRRKTQRPSSVERDRRCDRRLRNSSLCFTARREVEVLKAGRRIGDAVQYERCSSASVPLSNIRCASSRLQVLRLRVGFRDTA